MEVIKVERELLHIVYHLADEGDSDAAHFSANEFGILYAPCKSFCPQLCVSVGFTTNLWSVIILFSVHFIFFHLRSLSLSNHTHTLESDMPQKSSSRSHINHICILRVKFVNCLWLLFGLSSDALA